MKQSIMIHMGLFLILITTGFSSTIWTQIGSTCFQADKTKVTQQQASELCQKRGAVLHSIKDLQDFVDLKSVLESPICYWVWLKKIKNKFQWSDGRSCCPSGWWGENEPGGYDVCTRVCKSTDTQLWGYNCIKPYGFLCSKPAVKIWTLVNASEYTSTDLCGVGIMPNCDGLPCEDLCQYPDCDQFAKMGNLCVTIKNISSQTDNCIVNLRPNLELYRLDWNC